MSPPKVLVVGAGPTGLGLALTLLQNGVAVRIIDKRSVYAVGQRGAGVMPRTLEVYNILGILPDMLKFSYKVPLMRLYELPGGTKPIKDVVMMPDFQATPAIPYPVGLGVGQDMQEHVLRSHIAKYSCHVEMNTELHTLVQHPENVAVTLVHSDSSQGSTTEITEFDYVVGADGAHSATRKLLGIGFPGKVYELENIVIGDIQIKAGLDEEFWHTWGSPKDKMVQIRSGCQGDGVFVISMFGVNLDSNKILSSREELIKEIHNITGRIDIEFGDVVWLSQYRPNIRMVSQLRDGRVFLAGDAAHCHSHVGAQGMNSSFQDAFNLGWKLALVLKGYAPQGLLDTYNEERIPVITEMLQKATAILQATFKPQDDSGREWYRGDELRMLGVNYRKSSIVVDSSPPSTDFHASYDPESAIAARGGDRAPDAPALQNLTDLSGPTSLFQVLRCYCHTVIVFTRDTVDHSGILAVCNGQPAGTICTCLIVPEDLSIDDVTKSSYDYAFGDKEGHAFENYQISDTRLKIFAVRPDGVIGAAIESAQELKVYFYKIFVLVSN